MKVSLSEIICRSKHLRYGNECIYTDVLVR